MPKTGCFFPSFRWSPLCPLLKQYMAMSQDVSRPSCSHPITRIVSLCLLVGVVSSSFGWLAMVGGLTHHQLCSSSPANQPRRSFCPAAEGYIFLCILTISATGAQLLVWSQLVSYPWLVLGDERCLMVKNGVNSS